MRHIPIIVFALVIIFVMNIYADVAVIVNKSNPVSDISFIKIKQILEARMLYWDNGEKITLIFKPVTSDETRVLLDKVYKIKYEEFEKYWSLKVYQNKTIEFPKILNSSSTINILVSEIPGAIAFIAVNEVSTHGNIKVLKINGTMPQEDSYPFK